nr:uncharacterized protein LOC118681891 [Bactrocera oleae]
MPTYTKGDASSIVDLTFVSSSIARKNCNWRVLNIYTASDHNAILWETANHQSPRRSNNQLNTIGWKVKSFDPSALLVSLDSDPIITGPAEDKTKDLLTRLTRACDASMPRKRGNNQRPSVHWWNDRVSTLRAKCLKKRRISKRGYRRPNSAELIAEYKQARRNLNKAIKESKRRCWTELVEEVDRDPWGRPYKVVMTHLKSQPMPSPTCPQLLLKIVAALFPRQRDFMYSSLQLNSEDIPPVTKEELMEASNRVGNNKTPGLDGIPNIALKTSVKSRYSLTSTTPASRRGLYLVSGNSNDWYYYLKVKNHQKSCHPLCMLDTVGKIFERIIHQRIEAVVDPLLADNQYGFRKGRSTLDAINLVVNTTKEAIAGTRWKGGTKKYCLVAALDIRNALNSAKWDCISPPREKRPRMSV